MKQQPKETTVRVVRAFLMGGEPVPVDTVITLETPFANQLISSNKAVRTDEAPREPKAPKADGKSEKGANKQEGGPKQ